MGDTMIHVFLRESLTDEQKKAVEERIHKILRGEAVEPSAASGLEDSMCVNTPVVSYCKDL